MEADDARSNPVPATASGRARHGLVFDLGALMLLTAVSLMAGCMINALRADPIPWIYLSRAQTMATAVAEVASANPSAVAVDDHGELPHEIRLEEFQSFVSENRGLVLDARPSVFYREAHIPGAISLPREAFAKEYPSVRTILEASKPKPIVIYCSGADCPDSQLLSDALTKLGYRHLLIYTSGWDEWSQTGLPQEGASPKS